MLKLAAILRRMKSGVELPRRNVSGELGGAGHLRECVHKLWCLTARRRPVR
jgi:hypothetical protein